MLTDEQYGQELGVHLRHETADVHTAPDLVRKLRRRQARRSWAIRTAIATPVAAAAAAVVVTVPGPGAPDGRHQINGAQVQLENVSYVQEQTVRALSQASQYVIYAKSTYGSGYYDEWIDKATQRYRNDVYTSDAPVSQAPPPDAQAEKTQASTAPTDQTRGPIRLSQSHSVSGPDSNQEIITVDYDLRNWSKDRAPAEKPQTGPDITDADSVRKAISDGTIELLGREKVDGVDTLHLRLYGPKQSYRIDMWVDGTTYLPVQQTAAKGDGKAFPASSTVTTKYSWLPRTEENLARLVLTPPPGFAQVK
jgi:outer membrane lipoprotein-sorting protein